MVTVFAGCGAARAACGSEIAEFERITGSDANTGNLNKRVYARIVAELGPVRSSCVAGRDAEATRSLAGVKHRFGYR